MAYRSKLIERKGKLSMQKGKLSMQKDHSHSCRSFRKSTADDIWRNSRQDTFWTLQSERSMLLMPSDVGFPEFYKLKMSGEGITCIRPDGKSVFMMMIVGFLG